MTTATITRLSRPLLLLTTLTAAPLLAQDVLIQCKTLVVAPDTVIEPGELLIRDGKVTHVGREIPADLRARARTMAFPDATAVPGFVLVHSTLEQDKDLAERAFAWTPELRAAEAFDPFQDDLDELAPQGVTSCLLSPSSDNVAGGIAALVKPGAEFGRVADDEVYLKLSLSTLARNQERPPTSLMGAMDLLRTAFSAARDGVQGGPDLAPLRDVLNRDRRACIHVDTYAELMAALDLAREFEFEPVLLGARQAYDCIDRIAAARAPVALRPLRPEMREVELQLPARLESVGVPFCFLGRPDELRTSAALAVRHGASRKAALAAITRTPADLLGLTEQVGALRRGCDGDVAIFSGAPLDLSSRLQAVFIDGELRHGSAPPAGSAAPELASAKENL